MKRFAVVLLLLTLFASGVPSAFGQSCATPPPTYTPTPGYRATVQAVAPGNLLGYFPMDETTGTTAEDDSGNNADGTYSGVTLNAATFLTGQGAPSFDGVNDYMTFLTTYLQTHFPGQEVTMLVWVKVNAGYWTDNTQRFIIRLFIDASYDLRIYKPASNLLNWRDIVGGVTRIIQNASTPTDWIALAFTRSESGSVVRAYRGGQVVSTMTAPGAWAGTLANAVVGSAGTSGAQPHVGNIAQVAIWNTALDPTQVAVLATVDPVLTIPPTATLCPSWTPTFTPSHTPTYTPTPTTTPNLAVFWTMPAPVGTALPDATGTPTPAPGQDVVFYYTITSGQQINALLDGGILFTIWALAVLWLITGFRRRKARKPN